MKDEEHAYRDAHFHKELDSLKVSVTCLTSLLEKKFKIPLGTVLLIDPPYLFRPRQ